MLGDGKLIADFPNMRLRGRRDRSDQNAHRAWAFYMANKAVRVN